MKTIWILMLVTLSQSPALANPVAEMTQYFAESIQTSDQAINQCSMPAPGAEDEIWYFRRFWLRLRPKASFAIPSFAKLEIAPELELLWQR